MASNLKRGRMENGSGSSAPHKKGKTDGRNYYARAQSNSHRRDYLKVGQRGFMVTCNTREKDCIRDSFRLLNEYADEMYGKLDENREQKATGNSEEEEEDISVLVEKQAEAARKEKRRFRFEAIDTGLNNCCFISTILDDPKELALRILRDLTETKKLKSRHILRLMPIEVVAKANLKDIINAAGQLFDKYFLGKPKTFAIIFNRRLNNSLDRLDVINELASVIASKNRLHKANLKQPELAVIVEIIKGLCLISVVPQFYELKKYNLAEICGQRSENGGQSKDSDPVPVEQEEKTVTEGSKDPQTTVSEISQGNHSHPVTDEKKVETLAEVSQIKEQSSSDSQTAVAEKPEETVSEVSQEEITN